jgi:hypothetical protein
VNIAKIAEVFIGGIILIAVLAVLFTAKNTSSVISSTGGFVSNSLKAAEAPTMQAA